MSMEEKKALYEQIAALDDGDFKFVAGAAAGILLSKGAANDAAQAAGTTK